MPEGQCPTAHCSASNELAQKNGHEGFEEPGEMQEESTNKLKQHSSGGLAVLFWFYNILRPLFGHHMILKVPCKAEKL